jgi:glycosyltransferase involved in cell wall biosynthesis
MKLSVCMITYNHEDFIAQALDSVLMQDVDFDYEIVLGEDCSTDNTRDIARDYASRFPNRVQLLPAEKNLGMKHNFIRTLRACRGQYVASCEGDDYWTSPHKLAKQVSFLEMHPECAVCFHNVEVIYEDQSQEPQNYCSSGQKEISGLEDILKGNFIPTCSVMFRRRPARDFPEWFYALEMGDWPLHLLNAEQGEIGYIDQVMGVYRVHSGGAWYSLSQIEAIHEYIKFYHYANAHLGFRYQRLIKTCLSNCYCALASAYALDGDLAKARMYARRSLAERPLGRSHLDARPYLVMLRSHAPRAYQVIKKIATKAGCLPQPES